MDPPLPRQESSGALPKIADVQPADLERYIKPIIKEMYAEFKAAVKEHMALVKSQYETGLSKASRDTIRTCPWRYHKASPDEARIDR